MGIDGRTEYEASRKKGLREYNSRRMSGRYPYLHALDTIISTESIVSEVSLGQIDIPINKIVGTKTLGRSKSFAPNFMPILSINTEFASKWINLCIAHLTEGIRDPIKVYEYLNRFYAEEGNKRVSVLKFHEAVSIPGIVTRLVPKYDEQDETIVLYYEFMEFYKQTRINNLWMSRRDNFNKLLKQMKRYDWIEPEKSIEFNSIYHRFRKVYHELGGDKFSHTTGDAFLKYLEIFHYEIEWTNDEIKRQLSNMWEEFKLLEEQEISLEVSTSDFDKKSLFSLPSFSGVKNAKIAFVNSKSPDKSAWTYGHEIGRNHCDNVFGSQITTAVFNDVPEDESAYDTLVNVVQEGYDVVFTTSPTFINATLKAAVEFKNVKFFNCSENMSYKSVRTYFGRIYEPNFLVGIAAGAMTKKNRIGYVVTYPIPEVISSINAFTLGARFVNPKATVIVKWVDRSEYKKMDHLFETQELEESYNWDGTTPIDICYDIDQQLIDMDVDIISHQESSDLTTKLKNSGIYFVESENRKREHMYLATPVWNWGEFYERMIRSILSGSYNRLSSILSNSEKAINYWWGMDTDVVDIIYTKSGLPRETIQTIKFMKEMIINGTYHPFRGPLYDSKKVLRLDEGHNLEAEAILTMDWFVEGVLGSIPTINAAEDNHPLLEMLSVKKKY
jgi:basic membrane protein A and related proteins